MECSQSGGQNKRNFLFWELRSILICKKNRIVLSSRLAALHFHRRARGLFSFIAKMFTLQLPVTLVLSAGVSGAVDQRETSKCGRADDWIRDRRASRLEFKNKGMTLQKCKSHI